MGLDRDDDIASYDFCNTCQHSSYAFFLFTFNRLFLHKPHPFSVTRLNADKPFIRERAQLDFTGDPHDVTYFHFITPFSQFINVKKVNAYGV